MASMGAGWRLSSHATKTELHGPWSESGGCLGKCPRCRGRWIFADTRLSPILCCRQVKDRMKKQRDAKTALKAKDIKASGPKAAKIAPRAGAKAGKR